jgi:ribonuclease E
MCAICPKRLLKDNHMKTRKMLINATQPEETRVAIVDNQELIDFDIEPQVRVQKKANIYKARISRIEPSLNAVFVDYGSQRHGFLPVKEIAPEYLSKPIKTSADIREALCEDQEIIIQIEKEERGSKGAAVTTYITLAGCYLVLMPNDPKASGISRRIEGEDRKQLKAVLNDLSLPDDMGVIARTSCLGRSIAELQWDLDALLKLWSAVKNEAEKGAAPFLIYQEGDVILRSIRDYLREDITTIIVDQKNTYERVLHYVKQLRPAFVNRVAYYDDQIPLFTRYHVEQQIETAHEREITLPSGGAIVIDHTEALTSIDINSARATKGSDIEETATQTNLEAASEIARQLRLRDLGGLVVIDFIDMIDNKNQRRVEAHLAEALRLDRARVQFGRISKFGLLEMSRQRLRSSLGEASNITCPRCLGQGTIRTIQSLSLSIIRQLREIVLRQETQHIDLQVPVEVATYLLNEKRQLIAILEAESGIRILIIPNPNLETPHYEINRSRMENTDSSHEMIGALETASYHEQQALSQESPAITSLEIESAPQVKRGLFESISRICASLIGGSNSTVPAANSVPEKPKQSNPAPRKPAQRAQQTRQRNDRRSTQRANSNRNQTDTKHKHHDAQNTDKKPATTKPRPAPKPKQPMQSTPKVAKQPKVTKPKEPHPDNVLAVIARYRDTAPGADQVESATKAKTQKYVDYQIDVFNTKISNAQIKRTLAALHDVKMTVVESKKPSQLPPQEGNLDIEVIEVAKKKSTQRAS